ncbi:Uncharacterised protein g8626 [Pycnogonum litorale]
MRGPHLLIILLIGLSSADGQDTEPQQPSSVESTPFKLSAGYELILRNPVKEGFTCEGRPYGYYADADNDCQIFHVCQPLILGPELQRTLTYSFFCPNQTVFDQKSLVCIFPGNDFDCQASISFAEQVNSEFGKVERTGRARQDVDQADETPVATNVDRKLVGGPNDAEIPADDNKVPEKDEIDKANSQRYDVYVDDVIGQPEVLFNGRKYIQSYLTDNNYERSHQIDSILYDE